MLPGAAMAAGDAAILLAACSWLLAMQIFARMAWTTVASLQRRLCWPMVCANLVQAYYSDGSSLVKMQKLCYAFFAGPLVLLRTWLQVLDLLFSGDMAVAFSGARTQVLLLYARRGWLPWRWCCRR